MQKSSKITCSKLVIESIAGGNCLLHLSLGHGVWVCEPVYELLLHTAHNQVFLRTFFPQRSHFHGARPRCVHCPAESKEELTNYHELAGFTIIDSPLCEVIESPSQSQSQSQSQTQIQI